MLKFNGFGELEAFFSTNVKTTLAYNLEEASDDLGAAVAKEVRDEIGHLQKGVGQFPAWPPLAQSTIEKKARLGLGLGGNPDSPLYATGEFQGDISYVGEIKSGGRIYRSIIGTSKEYVLKHELGSGNVPARPVFGPAALRAVPTLEAKVGRYAFNGVIGVRGA